MQGSQQNLQKLKGEGENLLDQLKSDINHTWVRRFLIHEPLHYDLVNVKVMM